MTSPRSRAARPSGRSAARPSGRSAARSPGRSAARSPGRRAGVLLAVVVLATGLAACGGGKDGGGGDDPTKVLAAAKQQLDDTPGVRLSLRTKALPEGVDGILDATGVGTHAPAFKGEIKVLFNGLSATVPIVAVGGKVYAKLPFSGNGFDPINPDDYGAPDPAGLLDPDTGVATWLTAATGVEKGKQSRNGKQVLTDYTGTVPGEAVAAVIPSANKAAGFPATFSLDGDGRLVSADITGPFYTGKEPVAYTLGLSDYGTDQEITAP
ncbi:LppX_LprAFG lipoprotein [Nocardioides marmoribigeumensis]|uniref:LppX_LprAFG lipoprotein n=1 Tax=Nocardioides marmoribigeumensis TaxID=433649 RepID=UPI0031D4604B